MARRSSAPQAKKHMKIRAGDRVVVLSGKDRGAEGVVLKAFPAESRVIVEGVNVQKRHEKPKQAGEPGGIREVEGPIHVSNVAILDGGRPSRVGYRIDGGRKVRIARSSGGEV